MINYYKISSPNTDKVYIGCTSQSLPQRLAEHVYGVGKANRRKVSSEEIILAGNPTIELIDQLPSDTCKNLKRKREQELIQENNSCNKRLNKKPI